MHTLCASYKVYLDICCCLDIIKSADVTQQKIQ